MGRDLNFLRYRCRLRTLVGVEPPPPGLPPIPLQNYPLTRRPRSKPFRAGQPPGSARAMAVEADLADLAVY